MTYSREASRSHLELDNQAKASVKFALRNLRRRMLDLSPARLAARSRPGCHRACALCSYMPPILLSFYLDRARNRENGTPSASGCRAARPETYRDAGWRVRGRAHLAARGLLGLCWR